MQQPVLSKDNKELKKVELNDSIFKAPVRRQLLFDAVQMYLNNKRQGTASAKFRHEVKGSTRKIYRQKGTGNARHGSIRAGIFVGGGIAHPPKPKDWTYQLPRGAKQEALRTALSLKTKKGSLIVVEDIHAEKNKTQAIAKQLKKWKLGSCLLVVDIASNHLVCSARNLANVDLTTADDLNAFQVMAYDKVVFTEKALQTFEKRLG